jgi:hypothetical protein
VTHSSLLGRDDQSIFVVLFSKLLNGQVRELINAHLMTLLCLLVVFLDLFVVSSKCLKARVQMALGCISFTVLGQEVHKFIFNLRV